VRAVCLIRHLPFMLAEPTGMERLV
jgi:hypothetical protein